MKPLFIRTSKGILNRNLIVFCGFYKNSRQIHLNLIGGFSFRFEGDEALQLLQMLNPSVAIGKSKELNDFIKDTCSDLGSEAGDDITAEIMAYELMEEEK